MLNETHTLVRILSTFTDSISVIRPRHGAVPVQASGTKHRTAPRFVMVLTRFEPQEPQIHIAVVERMT
jgi:hypothetical protein